MRKFILGLVLVASISLTGCTPEYCQFEGATRCESYTTYGGRTVTNCYPVETCYY